MRAWNYFALTYNKELLLQILFLEKESELDGGHQ